jgi:hypothetical protein
MILCPSENKEHDKKHRKLDHLMSSTGNGESENGVRRCGQFLVEKFEFIGIV